jgi:hypothetical protein
VNKVKIEFVEAELVLLHKVLDNVAVTGIGEMRGVVLLYEKIRAAALGAPVGEESEPVERP